MRHVQWSRVNTKGSKPTELLPHPILSIRDNHIRSGCWFNVCTEVQVGIEEIDVHHSRLDYRVDGSIYDSRLVNPSWNGLWAISCPATLSGNIDYGLQAYQLHLKATRIVRSYVGLIQANVLMMTTTHNLRVMHLTQRETDLWTSASSHRTEHQRCI